MAEVFPTSSVDAIRRIGYGVIVRAAAVTTTSYVESNHFRCVDGEWLSLDFTLAWVDSTSTEWYVEWSPDGTNFHRSLNYSAAAGVITASLNNATIASSASIKWNDGPIVVQDTYARVVVKKTGGVGADTLAVVATLMVQK